MDFPGLYNTPHIIQRPLADVPGEGVMGGGAVGTESKTVLFNMYNNELITMLSRELVFLSNSSNSSLPQINTE